MHKMHPKPFSLSGSGVEPVLAEGAVCIFIDRLGVWAAEIFHRQAVCLRRDIGG